MTLPDAALNIIKKALHSGTMSCQTARRRLISFPRTGDHTLLPRTVKVNGNSQVRQIPESRGNGHRVQQATIKQFHTTIAVRRKHTGNGN